MGCAYLIIPILINIVHSEFIINSPQVTNYGTWGQWQNCADGRFVKAIDVKIAPDPVAGLNPPPNADQIDNIDDQGITHIAIECAPPYNPPTQNGGILIAPRQLFPSFRAPLRTPCEGVATGFQLLSDDPHISLDNAGALNIRIFCSGLTKNPTTVAEAYGTNTNVGTWTAAKHCKTRQAICGFNTQNHPGALFGDKTGINNVRFKCCDLPSPVTRCIPTDSWELIQECDNTNETSPTVCTYNRMVGVGILAGQDMHPAVYRDRAFGFDIEDGTNPSHWLYGELSLKTKNWVGLSRRTDYDWRVPGLEPWHPNIITQTFVEAKEGYRSLVFQVVGKCSYINVRTTRFKKIDVDKFDPCQGVQCLSSKLHESS